MGKLNEKPVKDSVDKKSDLEKSALAHSEENKNETEASLMAKDDVVQPKDLVTPKAKESKIKQLLKSKKFRIAVPVIVLLLAIVAVTVKPVQYALLNTFSKGNVEFIVVDDETLAPVEATDVIISGRTLKTDKNGRVVAKDIPYGSNTYKISKELYDSKSENVEVKPGVNLVGPIKIHSEGVPLKFTVSNKLSNESVKEFQVSVDGSKVSARSNKNGQAIIKLPTSKKGALKLTVSAEGFIKNSYETAVIDAIKQKTTAIQLTPEGNHYFLSNRTGKIDIYSANLDGSNQQQIINGSDADDSSTVLSIAPDGKFGALISKRDNQKGPDGQIIAALYSIDFAQKTIKRIDEGAPQFNILGWSANTRLAYTINYNDYSKKDNSKLKTADVTNGQLNTLITQKGYLNASLYNEDPTHVYLIENDTSIENYGIFSVDLATKKSQRLNQVPSYEIYHGRPYFLDFLIDNKSFSLDMKSQSVQSASNIRQKQNQYLPSPNGQKIAWLENRDGKGAVIVGDSKGENGKPVTSGVNAVALVRWMSDDYLFYNSSDQGGSTDHILHVLSGTSTKISDTYRLSGYGR